MKVNTPKQFVTAYNKFGSIKAVARHVNPEKPMSGYSAMQKLYKEAVAQELMAPIRPGRKSSVALKDPRVDSDPSGHGSVKALSTEVVRHPKRGVKRYLFTSAQNNTQVHDSFWTNLNALAKHYKAEVHVSRYTYSKRGAASRQDKAYLFSDRGVDVQDMWWDEKLKSSFSDKRLEIAPGLVWCGEMNTSPTAVNPLSGLEVYSGRKSGIFPHAKVAMEPIASGKFEATKHNYTTGTTTLRNYIQRKEGLKAEFHHTYGALLVEVDSKGDWWTRQIIGDSEGVIYDIDLCVEDGKVTRYIKEKGNGVAAITWGDIHRATSPEWLIDLCFGKGGVLDRLRPTDQFFHDVIDFRQPFGHHNKKRPHTKFKLYLEGAGDLRREAEDCRDFLNMAVRSFTMSNVVHSNHHQHIGRWLEEVDGRHDPKNFVTWTNMQTRTMQFFTEGGEYPDYFKLLMDEVGFSTTQPIRFLSQDESVIICEDASGGIECGMHGHAGPNGSRGTPTGFKKLGRKINIADKHSAGIYDGCYVAGTFSTLTPDWTEGPSSWSHTFTITYPNGKRAQITCWEGKAWAPR